MKYYHLAVILLESGKFTYDQGKSLIEDFQALASKEGNEEEVMYLDWLSDRLYLYIPEVVEAMGKQFFPEVA